MTAWSMLAWSETERRLAAIWRRWLGRKSIERGDDFFVLGGHSLLAVQVFDDIERVFGSKLSLTLLFETPTLDALAARIDASAASRTNETRSSWTSVVSLQPNGRLEPLFCVAGAGGIPFGERHLVSVLGPEQPLYGLQHRGADGRLPPHRSIPELARDFMADVLRLQPNGPYYLGGFSGGGVVAQELARLLSEAGAEVRLLLLLDSYNPQLAKWDSLARAVNLGRLAYHHGASYAAQRLVSRARAKTHLLKYRIFDPSGSEFEQRHQLLETAFVAALDEFTPAPYRGDAVVIRTSGRPCPDVDYRTHESNGWRGVIQGRLEVVSLDCRHDQVLGECAPLTAQLIRRALAAARTPAAESLENVG
jgi:thioesterase domain-containing protein